MWCACREEEQFSKNSFWISLDGRGGCQSVHGMSLVQIAFLSFRLAGYFSANAGGGAIPAKLYTLLRGVGLRHPVIRRHVSFRARLVFHSI